MKKFLHAVKKVFLSIFTPAPNISLAQENERKANIYMAWCLLGFAIFVIITFVSLFIDPIFDIPYDTIPYYQVILGILLPLLVIPCIFTNIKGVTAPWFKHVVLSIFMITLVVCSVITYKHMLLAWALPLVLVLHYYNPKISRVYFFVTLVCIPAAVFLSLFFGEWDNNIMGEVIGGQNTVAFRIKWIDILNLSGINLYLNTFINYSLPNMGILVLIYISCRALSRRTFELTKEMSEIATAAERLESEFNFAKSIQQNALPRSFPNDKRIDLNARVETAKFVGGDFYDFFYIDEDHFFYVVADTSGKGVPAAMFMMKAKTLFDSSIKAGYPLDKAIKHVNTELRQNNETFMFVTAWAAIINIKNGTIQYINAGHNQPIIKRQNGEAFYLDQKPNCFLGVKDKIDFKVHNAKLKDGDKILLYTDGVTEAIASDKSFYGEDRLLNLVKENDGSTSKELVEKVFDDVKEFSKDCEQADDITVLSIIYKEKDNSNDLVVTSEIRYLDRVIEFINGSLTANKADPKTIAVFDICVDEIFSNIVKFAYAPSIGDVRITMEYKGDSVSVHFVDSGVKYNPLLKTDPKLEEYKDLNKIGGLGIYLIKQNMDDLSYKYENEKNILTITKKYR